MNLVLGCGLNINNALFQAVWRYYTGYQSLRRKDFIRKVFRNRRFQKVLGLFRPKTRLMSVVLISEMNLQCFNCFLRSQMPQCFVQWSIIAVLRIKKCTPPQTCHKYDTGETRCATLPQTDIADSVVNRVSCEWCLNNVCHFYNCNYYLTCSLALNFLKFCHISDIYALLGLFLQEIIALLTYYSVQRNCLFLIPILDLLQCTYEYQKRFP